MIAESTTETAVALHPEPSPLFPGCVLDGRYRLIKRIGKGGMGVVFSAEHIALRKKVAVKLVRADHAACDAYRDRLLREARVGAALSHPSIVQVLDVGTGDQGCPYLVLELVQGPTLAEVLRENGAFTRERAAHVIACIAQALKVAHRLGIVHRDLKPHNIMVQAGAEESDQIKILDFGIAKEATSSDESEATLTQAGAAGGTPHYMAPEVARGETRGDKSVDIYALGAIFYELLSGRRLHSGECRNAIIYNVTQGKPPRLSTLIRDLPAELESLVHDALAPDANKRPTIEDFISRLDRVRDKLPTHGTTRPPAHEHTSAAPSRAGGRQHASRAAAALVLLGIGYGLAVFKDVPATAENNSPRPDSALNTSELKLGTAKPSYDSGLKTLHSSQPPSQVDPRQTEAGTSPTKLAAQSSPQPTRQSQPKKKYPELAALVSSPAPGKHPTLEETSAPSNGSGPELAGFVTENPYK